MSTNHVTINLLNGPLKFAIRGNAESEADAAAYAEAKLALTVGTIDADKPATTTTTYAVVGDPATGAHGDATFEMFKSGNGVRTVRLENCTTAIVLPDSGGRIDVTDPLVTDLADAFRDGDGDGGYDCLSGHMVV